MAQDTEHKLGDARDLFDWMAEHIVSLEASVARLEKGIDAIFMKLDPEDRASGHDALACLLRLRNGEDV